MYSKRKNRRINLYNINKKCFNVLLPLRKLSFPKPENIDKIPSICYHKIKGGENMTKTKKIITFSVIGVIAAAVLAAGIYLLCVILAFGNSKAYFDDIVIQNPDELYHRGYRYGVL